MENDLKKILFSQENLTLFLIKTLLPAEVAELVDALDSGSSVRKDVRVQISLSAPFLTILTCILF